MSGVLNPPKARASGHRELKLQLAGMSYSTTREIKLRATLAGERAAPHSQAKSLSLLNETRPVLCQRWKRHERFCSTSTSRVGLLQVLPTNVQSAKGDDRQTGASHSRGVSIHPLVPHDSFTVGSLVNVYEMAQLLGRGRRIEDGLDVENCWPSYARRIHILSLTCNPKLISRQMLQPRG